MLRHYAARETASIHNLCLPTQTRLQLCQNKMFAFRAIPRCQLDGQVIPNLRCQLVSSQFRGYSTEGHWDFWRNHRRAMRLSKGLITLNVIGYVMWQYSFSSPEEKREVLKWISAKSWMSADYVNSLANLKPSWMAANATNSLKNIREGRYWTLLTSAFSHVNFPHILCKCASLCHPANSY